MRFECIPFFNETSRFDPYTEGDRLTASKIGYMEVEADTAQQAAERVFALLNRDDRPNGSYERSLSVGDVVHVQRGETGRENFHGTRFACDPVGWREVPYT